MDQLPAIALEAGADFDQRNQRQQRIDQPQCHGANAARRNLTFVERHNGFEEWAPHIDRAVPLNQAGGTGCG